MPPTQHLQACVSMLGCGSHATAYSTLPATLGGRQRCEGTQHAVCSPAGTSHSITDQAWLHTKRGLCYTQACPWVGYASQEGTEAQGLTFLEGVHLTS